MKTIKALILEAFKIILRPECIVQCVLPKNMGHTIVTFL